jgi:hypothetical protein
MRKYLDDTVWNNCLVYVANAVIAYTLNPPPTNPSGTNAAYYYAYTRGHAAAYAYTRNAQFKEALSRISDITLTFPHAYAVGVNFDDRIREQTFSFNRLRYQRKMSGVQTYTEEDYASSLIAMIDEISNGGTMYTFHQPFLVGVAMQSLVEYYIEDVNDERIPVVIKQYLDKFETDWWDDSVKEYSYNPEPLGPRCYTGCETTTGSILNGLIAPAYWWIFRMTGDTAYRDFGDYLFEWQSGPMKNNGPYQAKNWSEMNYWMFDGLDWRTGKARAH